MSKMFVKNCYVSKENLNIVQGYVQNADHTGFIGTGKYQFPFKVVMHNETDFNLIKDACGEGLFIDVELKGLDNFSNPLYEYKGML